MSLQSILYPNNNSLYSSSLSCNTINTSTLNTNEIVLPNDTDGLQSVSCSLYTKTGPTTYVQQRGGITLNYAVHKNTMVMFMRSSTGDFNLSGTSNVLYLGPYNSGTNQPIPWHIPYKIESEDGNMCSVINIKLTNATVCKFEIDTNVSGIAGDTIINFYAISPNGGPTAGSFNDMVLCNVCNWVEYFPVSYVG